MNPMIQRKKTILPLLIGLALACFVFAPMAQSQRDVCASGYVWREAQPTDHVCVTPASRDLVAQENRAARQRWTTGAYGPHTCLGLHLARMETTVALNGLLDRLPDLELDPDAEPPLMMGMGFRSPTAVPVRWRAG